MPARITWYGHATFLYESPQGVRILVDPWFDGNPKAPAERPDRIDVVLLTHGHGDHVTNAVEMAKANGAEVVAPVELATWASGQGVEQATGFNKGGTYTTHGVAFTMTNAVHTEGVNVGDDVIYGGLCGYVITFEDGFRVYHAGDTAVHMDMVLVGELYRPDLAVLPIGDHYTMGPFQAAHAVRLLGVGRVLGAHYGTFPALSGTPAALREELGKLGIDATVEELEPGGTLG